MTSLERPLRKNPGSSESLIAFGAGGDHLVISHDASALRGWNLLTGEVTHPTPREATAGGPRTRLDAFIDALDYKPWCVAHSPDGVTTSVTA